MSSIRDIFIQPSKGWFVEDEITKRRIPTAGSATSYINLKEMIISHRRGNDLEYTSKEVEDMIHRQTCEREPESFCQMWKGIHVITNGVKDGARIVASGFKQATPEVQAQRKAICLACSYWNQKGYGGIGKCGKCNCARYMWVMAAKKCPLSKWLPVK